MNIIYKPKETLNSRDKADGLDLQASNNYREMSSLSFLRVGVEETRNTDVSAGREKKYCPNRSLLSLDKAPRKGQQDRKILDYNQSTPAKHYS